MQQRVRRARRKRDDPRATHAVHAAVCDSIETVVPRCGVAEEHAWRVKRDGDAGLVFGDAAVSSLASAIRAWNEYDPDDARWCHTSARARARAFGTLRQRTVPDECARGAAVLAEADADAAAQGGDVVDWRRFELDVRTGERAPSDDETLAYFASPVRDDEVRGVARGAARRKAPSPADWVTSDVIAVGGAAVWRVLALLFSCVLATGNVPPPWRVGFRRDLYKKGSRLDWLSFRGIVLGSNLAKCFERVLLRRVALLTSTDEWQAVGGVGIDVRHQILVLVDVLAARAADGLVTWGAAVDVTRAFPSTEHALAALAAHGSGVRGHVLRALIGLIVGVSVRARIAPGQHTPAILLGVGLLEGAVLSPRLFAGVCDGLLAALRASGLGVSFGGVWVGALMLMDDLVVLARSELELRSMLDVVFAWCWGSRLGVNLEKTHVFVRAAVGLAAPSGVFAVDWAPSTDDEPDAARRAAARLTRNFEIKAAGVRYLGYILGRHIAELRGWVSGIVAKIEAGFAAREPLTLAQALWSWDLHGRARAESCAAVLPPLGDEDAGALEELQRRALLAMLGPAASDGAHYELLLYVFGRWRLDERRLLARLVFARSLALSLARPSRAAVVAELVARVGEPSARGRRLAGEAATSAVLDALGEFGVGALPTPADAVAMRGPLWDATRAAGGSGDGGDEGSGSGDDGDGGGGGLGDDEGDVRGTVDDDDDGDDDDDDGGDYGDGSGGDDEGGGGGSGDDDDGDDDDGGGGSATATATKARTTATSSSRRRR